MVAVALCVRSQTAALAVVREGRVVEVQRRFLHRVRADARERVIERAVRRLVREYAADLVVTEPERRPSTAPAVLKAWRARAALHTLTNTTSYAGAFRVVLSRIPKLSRLVTTLPGQAGVASTERRRTVSLLAVALGLAASQ